MSTVTKTIPQKPIQAKLTLEIPTWRGAKKITMGAQIEPQDIRNREVRERELALLLTNAVATLDRHLPIKEYEGKPGDPDLDSPTGP